MFSISQIISPTFEHGQVDFSLHPILKSRTEWEMKNSANTLFLYHRSNVRMDRKSLPTFLPKKMATHFTTSFHRFVIKVLSRMIELGNVFWWLTAKTRMGFSHLKTSRVGGTRWKYKIVGCWKKSPHFVDKQC